MEYAGEPTEPRAFSPSDTTLHHPPCRPPSVDTGTPYFSLVDPKDPINLRIFLRLSTQITSYFL